MVEKACRILDELGVDLLGPKQARDRLGL